MRSLLRVVREFLVLFENYAGFTKIRNCMSPCILSDAVPQSICLSCFRMTPLCCLTCFVSHCSVFKVQVVERNFTSLSSPFGKVRIVPFFLLFPSQTLRWFEMGTLQPLLQSDLKIRLLQSGLQIQRQIAWWARVGSNHRPYDYQSYALAS